MLDLSKSLNCSARPTTDTMNNYVALIADATGRYAHVHVAATGWDSVIEQLEDIGCEVVENQSDDYEEGDFESKEYLKAVGVVTIEQLRTSSNFVPHP